MNALLLSKMVESNKHTIRLQLEDNSVSVELALEETVEPKTQMTALLYAKDFLAGILGLKVVQLMFDAENPTNEEEILQERMKTVIVKPGSLADMVEFAQKEDAVKAEEVKMYVNAKSQLIRIVPHEKNGRLVEMHQVLSFDVDTLPQAKHSYTGAGFSGFSKVARVKVPVKDGRS